MKKTVCVLFVLLLLLTQVSCGPADESKENFSNNGGVTQIGDNLYLRVGSGYLLANSALPRLSGLCRDPLCTHEGTEQRLALAQAVLGSPSILILDEPTAGLDPRQRISIRNYISRIALNKTVLIATHVVSDIEFIARNVIILKKGEIIADSPVRGLTSSIEGKVWLMSATAEDIGEIQRRWCVTSISHDEKTGGGGIQLRVLSDLSPSASAVPAVPTLEDYYLSVFGSTGTEG